MKRIFIYIYLLGLAGGGFAQMPQGFKYQAILRGSDGTPMANETVTLQIKIVDDQGASYYLEEHQIVTGNLGLVDVTVGNGTSDDDLASVDWTAGPFFLLIEVNDVFMGLSPVLSVPYAMYAEAIEHVSSSKALWADIPGGVKYDGGQVGIGTTDPQAPLHIHGNPTDDGGQLILSSPPGQDVYFTLYESDIYKSYVWWDASDADLRLQNRTKTDLSLNASGGNVGIGTKTPQSTLDVNGNVHVRGEIIIGGSGGGRPDMSISDLIGIMNNAGIIPNNFAGILEDMDGNLYSTIKLGSQTWMAENLKVTHLNDGTPLRSMTALTEEEFLISDYTWYNLDKNNHKPVYGAIYEYSAFREGNLCPSGWHVSTDQDWDILATYLGGADVAGGKLKDAGTIHWESPNSGATNETGFSAMPGGLIYKTYGEFDPIFVNMYLSASFWSPGEIGDPYIQRVLDHTGTAITRDSGWREGQFYEEKYLSIRCVKD